MARLLAFCESPRDFETIRALVERVLRERGPEWIRDLIESSLAPGLGALEWTADGAGRDYFDIHQVKSYASRYGIRVPHGHFAGRPGEAGALMGRTAFRVARELALTDSDLIAVLLVWDMDDQANTRRSGLEQARTEAHTLMPLAIVLGCPDPMREAWLLAGFEPETDAERERLAGLRQELGFNPCEEAHRLDAKFDEKREQAKRNPKRVLDLLTNGEYAREARCCEHVSLWTLRIRGEHSGLTAFLDETAALLVPRLSGEPPQPLVKRK